MTALCGSQRLWRPARYPGDPSIKSLSPSTRSEATGIWRRQHTSFRPPPAIKPAKIQCKGGWCEICQKEISSSRRLLDHSVTHDHSPDLFECSHIGCEAPLYTTKEALVRRKRIHESRTVVIVSCEYCAYKCHKDDLKSHQSSKRYRKVRAAKADTAVAPSKWTRSTALISSDV